MSGPKVVRVVTREEWEKRCKRSLDLLSRVIAKMSKAATAAGENDATVMSMSQQVIARFNALLDGSKFEEAVSYAEVQVSALQMRTSSYIEQAAKNELLREQRKIRSRIQAQQWLNLNCTFPVDLLNDLERISKGQSTLRSVDELFSEAEHIFEQQSINTVSELSESARNLAVELSSGTTAGSYKHEETIDPRVQAVTKCLSELRLLDDSMYQSTCDEWICCQTEADASRKRIWTDSLISDITQILRETKHLSKIIDKASVLETLLDTNGITVTINLAQAIDNRDCASIEGWITQAEQALHQYEAKQAIATRRQSILSGLSELGYSVSEQMSVIWERDGRIVLERPQLAGYGVELSGRENIQLRPVAFTDARDKKRDRDVETIWCGDFAELRNQLQESGNHLDIVRHLPIGAAPLAVVDRKSHGVKADEEENLIEHKAQ